MPINKLGLSWAKLKFSLVKIVDEVEVIAGVHYQPNWWMDGGGWLLGAVFNKINAKLALSKVGV